MSLTDFVVLGDKYEEKTSAVNLLKLPENIIVFLTKNILSKYSCIHLIINFGKCIIQH